MALYTKTIRNDSGCDTYETPRKSLDMILDRLDPAKDFLWEPFPGSGHSTIYMRERGFEVVNGSPWDFFEQELPVAPEGKSLILVSNPPYSPKQQIFTRFQELGLRRVALLLPAATIYTVYFNRYNRAMNDEHGQRLKMIVHTARCYFLDPTTGEAVRRSDGDGQRKGSASFDIAWITYGVDLPREIVFNDREPKKPSAEKKAKRQKTVTAETVVPAIDTRVLVTVGSGIGAQVGGAIVNHFA